MKLTYISTNLRRYTFESPKIKKWVENRSKGLVLNLFAGTTLLDLNEIRNDIDDEAVAEYHKDALVFVKEWDGKKFDTITLDPPYCYDKNTEILTENGWKLFKDLERNEKVATLNPKTNYLEYQKPTNYINQKYKGKMIQIASGTIDLMITPNHNLYIRKNWKTNVFKLIEAQQLNFGCNFKTDCKWKGENKTYFTLPKVSFVRHNRYNQMYAKPKKIKMVNFLRFLGLYLAEGCVDTKGTDYRIRIAQTKKPNRIIIQSWLNDLGYNYNIEKNGYSIYNKQLWSYLKQFGKTNDKFIPKDIKNLSMKQLGFLLEGLMLGDGHQSRKNIYNKKYKRYYMDSHKSYATTSKQLADDVSEIAFKCGYRCYNQQINGNHGRCYVINLSRKRRFPLIRKKKIGKYIRKIDYNDKIYCVEVPNHIIYIRRNGKPCWCGNSYRKSIEMYKGNYTSKFKLIADELPRILKPKGIVISLGYHSTFLGKVRGFEKQELCVFGHSGSQHCTIAIIEQRIKGVKNALSENLHNI